MSKTLCKKCNYYFSNKGGNYKKHCLVCDGSYRPAELKGTCKHCNEKFNLSDKPLGWMANHSRWCIKNPKRAEYKTNPSPVGLKAMQTPAARKKASESIKKAWIDGKYKNVNHASFLGKQHSEESKKKIQEKALKSNHRRLRRKMIEYNGIMLDSTWELELAKRLDEQNITWTRPGPIKWLDEDGLTHNYFPDFFLPDYNLYLDPKNPHAYKVQEKKINQLKKHLTNLIFLTNIDDIRCFSLLK